MPQITDLLNADERNMLTAAAKTISEADAMRLMVWLRSDQVKDPPVNLSLKDVQSLNAAFDKMLKRTASAIEGGQEGLACCCCTPCCCSAASVPVRAGVSLS